MPDAATLSPDAVLKQAIARHRAGELAAAEMAYQAVLSADPGHAEANHNLGVLKVQAGRLEEALAHLQAAVTAKPREALFVFSCAKGFLAAGKPREAAAVLQRGRQLGVADKRLDALAAQIEKPAARPAADGLRQALAARPDDAGLLDQLGSALLAEGKPQEAMDAFRQALVIQQDFADAHYHLGSALSENGRVAEGFEHFMRRAALVYGNEKAPPLDQPDPPYKIKHDLQQRDYLATGKTPPHLFHLAEGGRVEGRAVNPASPGLIEEWRRNVPQMVVIENFLTGPALEKLRAYCAGSTVWRKLYPAGYLGAAPEDGFACPLLAQIVEEIEDTFRPILAGEPFRYLGAFKYDSENCSGTNTHSDNSIVNVNFYIAPDEANLDPAHGGMEIWDVAAPSFEDMRKYNSNESAAHDFLRRSGARRTIIPHRANRAVIFKSTLFHKTDDFTFKSDYLSRRINVSLLFGRFGGI